MQTILLIETDPATLVTESLILRCLGYMVLEANNRGEAWRVCREHSGPVHVVMMKVTLDRDSSGEFITRLQCLYPQIRAVLISYTSSAKLPERQRIPCEYAVIQKSFRPDGLADAIKGLLDRRKSSAVSSFS